MTSARAFDSSMVIGSSGAAKINDSKHAKYLRQSFQIALNTPHVMQLVQYTMVPPRGRYKFFDMSILTSRGKPRKPFNTLAQWAAAELRSNNIAPLR